VYLLIKKVTVPLQAERIFLGGLSLQCKAVTLSGELYCALMEDGVIVLPVIKVFEHFIVQVLAHL